MPSDTSVKSSKSSRSQSKSSSAGKTKGSASTGSISKTASTAKNLSSADSKTSKQLSAQVLVYNEKDGYIQIKEVEGTALDSDDYYEYLYEDLIDAQGATASKLVSKESVKIKFDEEGNDICEICNMKMSDCPHITGTDLLTGEKNESIKVKVKKKPKRRENETQSNESKK